VPTFVDERESSWSNSASNTAAVSNDGGVLQFDIDTGSL